MPISFDRLADREPRLAALDRLATIACQNIRDDDPHWCANAFWGRYVKPLILPLVGWERGKALPNAPDPAGEGDPWVRMDGPTALALVMEESRWTRPVLTVAEELLRSQDAYDLVYRHLYDLLPPCRDCACIRVQEVAA